MFSVLTDWHQDNRAKPLVQQYLTALDSALESSPELQAGVVSCARCGVRFLPHPRNFGRTDLRCPFGCRELHRRLRSCQRSVAYYQTAVGRQKKQQLNDRRKHVSPPVPCPVPLPPVPPPPLPVEPLSEALPEQAELQLEEILLDEATLRNSPLLPYVRTVVNLLEGLRLSRQELVGRLVQSLRQHSIATRSRADYVLRYLHEHPP